MSKGARPKDLQRSMDANELGDQQVSVVETVFFQAETQGEELVEAS